VVTTQLSQSKHSTRLSYSPGRRNVRFLAGSGKLVSDANGKNHEHWRR